MEKKAKKNVKKEEVKNKEKSIKTNKKAVNLWWLLGLILPPVGLVLYILWRKNKKETAKSIGTASLISAIVLLFFGMSFLVHTNSEKRGLSKEIISWKETFESGETFVTVIASSTCPHCQNLKPIITASSKKHGYKLYFFEADKLTDEENGIISSSVELEDYEGYVPYTYVISEQTFISSHTGEMDDSELTKFLKDAKVIKN